LIWPYKKNEEEIELIQKEKGITIDEAKLQYSENLSNKSRTFTLETRCITAFFSRIFNSFHTKDCWKILVECVDVVIDERILNLSGVYTMQNTN
jgi:hypothetical protein